MRPAVALALAALAGCATAPPHRAPSADCRDFLAALDRRVAAAGVADGGTHRVPDHPYLRADRFTASFAAEATDPRRFSALVDALRALDDAARRAEIANLGESPAVAAQAEACGERLAALELGRPHAQERLRTLVHVPDDYAAAARVAGLYPLVAPLLARGVRAYQDEVMRDFARPLADLESPGALGVWIPAPAAPAPPRRGALRTDALGIPQPDPAQWQALLARHAPTWWIEEGGDYDRPGALALDARGRVHVDRGRPAVYYQTGHTRFGARVLPTLTYHVWFAERPALKRIDAAAGALDGVVWRVVLDEAGAPLAYDSIHACGCFHQHFPVQALAPLAQGRRGLEPNLLPQSHVPAGPVAVRLRSATHALRRVVPARAAHGSVGRYVLVPYEALLNLPHPGGGRRSAFGDDGRIAGTSRLERWWLWPSGVRDPGAMRQAGRHATAFVGQRHFDDARFLEQVYEIPPWAR